MIIAAPFWKLTPFFGQLKNHTPIWNSVLFCFLLLVSQAGEALLLRSEDCFLFCRFANLEPGSTLECNQECNNECNCVHHLMMYVEMMWTSSYLWWRRYHGCPWQDAAEAGTRHQNSRRSSQCSCLLASQWNWNRRQNISNLFCWFIHFIPFLVVGMDGKDEMVRESLQWRGP